MIEVKVLVQPLAKLKVLDVSQVMAGPFCCRLLGDLGAEVVKVEPPAGDQSRSSMHFRLAGEDSPGFYALNRNKRSIALDLKNASGREVFFELVRNADILVENGVPGSAKRLGIDFEAVRVVNPQIVYASISGFGQTGPWSDRPGFDLIAQAASGVMSVMGAPKGPPTKSSIPIADLGAGMFAAVAILSAIIRRSETGEGSYIDASLYEAALGLSVWESAEYFATGQSPMPIGTRNRMSAPYQAVQARDRPFVVAAANERLWKRFCQAIGRQDLQDDTRFAENRDRMTNLEQLIEEIEKTLAEADADTWIARLKEAGVPVGSINTFSEAIENPHADHRKQMIEIEHAIEGRIRAVGFPFAMSDAALAVRRPPPTLAEHTEEILQEIGLGGRLDDLRSSGAFGS